MVREAVISGRNDPFQDIISLIERKFSAYLRRQGLSNLRIRSKSPSKKLPLYAGGGAGKRWVTYQMKENYQSAQAALCNGLSMDLARREIWYSNT
jgi:hypothetical protein